MYIPPAFRNDDKASLHAVIDAARLANLVTMTAQGPMATPLPLLLDAGRGDHGVLIGHVARSNPQWSAAVDGEALAIWDWMFGTLYVTRGEEKLIFGLTDAEGKAIVQPHPTLRALLIEPFLASWRALQGGLRRLGKIRATGPE